MGYNKELEHAKFDALRIASLYAQPVSRRTAFAREWRKTEGLSLADRLSIVLNTNVLNIRRALRPWNLPHDLFTRLRYRPHAHTRLEDPFHDVRDTRGSYPANWTFRFLNLQEITNGSWFPAHVSPLWLKNLHSFRFLGAAPRPEVGWMLIDSWLKAVPRHHPVAWEPSTLAERLCHWIWWYSSTGSQNPSPKTARRFLRSVQLQLDSLSRFLKNPPRAGVTLTQCKAALIGGLFFGRESTIQPSLTMLDKEIRRQILHDGGHYERSPMYHALALEDLLVIGSTLLGAKQPLPGSLVQAIPRMADYAMQLQFPLGFPLLNDAAYGEGLPISVLVAVAERVLRSPLRPPPRTSRFFDESGFVILRSPSLSVLFDCGPFAPEGHSEHAHSDLLSICVWLGDDELLTDSGVHEYEQSPYRNYFRGAFAHNAPILDDTDPAELWNTFHVGRRPEPTDVAINLQARQARASHNGYEHLGATVRRSLELSDRGTHLCVQDKIMCSAAHSLVVRLHFSPFVQLAGRQGNTVQLIMPSRRRCQISIEGPAGMLHEKASLYSPEFGALQHRLLLEYSAELLPGEHRLTFNFQEITP